MHPSNSIRPRQKPRSNGCLYIQTKMHTYGERIQARAEIRNKVCKRRHLDGYMMRNNMETTDERCCVRRLTLAEGEGDLCGAQVLQNRKPPRARPDVSNVDGCTQSAMHVPAMSCIAFTLLTAISDSRD
jgi:hypothetical protein